MRDFRSLKVWQKSHEFVLAVYRLSTAFPQNEQYGLTHQLRRAAISVPSNIAEGAGRGTEKEFRQFQIIASGSISEAEYQLLLARDLGYLPDDAADALMQQAQELRRMVSGLISTIGRADG